MRSDTEKNKKSVTAKYYIQVMVFSGSVWYNRDNQRIGRKQK